MIKNVVFDLDRTIIDSYNCEIETLKKAIKYVTGHELTESENKQFAMLSTKEFYKLLKIDQESINEINKSWEEMFRIKPTKCFSEIKKVIKQLYEKGYFLAIVTSRTNEEVYDLGEEFKDTIDYFSDIITCDQISNSKPNPESMNILYKKFNLVPNETVYIGDSEIDMIFSNNSGCSFIQAAWDNDIINDTIYYCKNPCDLVKKVESLNNIIISGGMNERH